jgi:putative FmdB family regulatory protein
MPIYEYRCDNGHTFDVMRSFSDPPLEACIECGAPVHKVLHAPSVHFKGSGFYNTDYGTKKRARETEKAASDGADKNDAKTKEKADAKPESKPAASTSSSSSSSAKSAD